MIYQSYAPSKRQFVKTMRRKVFAKPRRTATLNRLRTYGSRYNINPVRGRLISQLKSSYDSAVFDVLNNGWQSRSILTGITQGPSGNLERIGDKIVVKKVMGRLIVQTEATNGTERWPVAESNNGLIVRIVIVEDKQSNGAMATSSDVFDDSFGTAKTTQQFNNLGNSERFKVWEDKIINLAQGQFPGGMVDFYLKTNIVVKYPMNATTGAITDILGGNIMLFVTCNYAASSPAEGSAGLTVKSHFRLRFTDL